jgi:uncharacterized membrane protein YbhN (UPF0104 family)
MELASLAALAGMQRRLLVAGRASVGVRPMLATTFAANAVSVSVPLAGPELGTLFTFRRLTRQGADATLASWSLLAGGLVSTATGALVVARGGLSSGNTVVLAAAAPVGLLAASALATVAMAAQRPRLRGVLERSAGWALRHGGRVLRRRTEDPGQTARAWAGRLGSLHLPPSGWLMVTGLALANWLADAAVLAVSIQSVGATVPWHVLLLIYGSGVAAQSLTITPGGSGPPKERSASRWWPPGYGPARRSPQFCCTAWSVSGWSRPPGGWSSSGCGATLLPERVPSAHQAVNPGPRQARWRGGAPS